MFSMACCGFRFVIIHTNQFLKNFCHFFLQPVFVIKTDPMINTAMMTDYVLVKRTMLVTVVIIAKLDHLVIPIAQVWNYAMLKCFEEFT